MEKINFIFTDEAGLHARPAGSLVKTALEFESSIIIKKDEKCASAKGLFAIMGLSIKKGDNVKIEIEGEDEKQAKEAVEGFLKENTAEIQTNEELLEENAVDIQINEGFLEENSAET